MRLPGTFFILLTVGLSVGPGPALAQEDQPGEVILGAPAAFDVSRESAETLSLPAGAKLREAPDLRAPEIATLDAPTDLPLLERQGAWVRVRFGARRAWVLAPGQSVPPPSPCPPSAAADDLAAARRALGPARAREGKLGPFSLLTDLPPGQLVDRLALIASGLPGAYRDRYGLDPGPSATAATVVLFSREADFLDYSRAFPDIAGLEPEGIAGNGLAAISLENRRDAEAEALLVHELTHLLNRCALSRGDALPPWLDEGLAEDLAFSPISSKGELRLGALAGRTIATDAVGENVLDGGGGRQVITVSGPKAHLLSLLEHWDAPERVELSDLMEQSVTEFSDPAQRGLHYTLAAFLVRYLLAGDGGRYRDPFQAFLAGIAAGKEASADELFRALVTGEQALEQDLHRWLRRESGRSQD